MRKNTRKLTLSAMFTALSVAFLYLASVIPTGQLGFAALASLCGAGAVIEAGVYGGVGVFAATSILGLIIIPEKTYMLLYVCFFGYYPVIKLIFERLKSRVLEWVCKIAVFNIAFTVLLFVFRVTAFDVGILSGRYWLSYIVMNAVFVIFDLGVSQVIKYYCVKISPHLGKNTGR